MHSIIVVDEHAVNILRKDGLTDAMMELRSDGRYNVRVSQKVRDLLDSYLVKHKGLDYSSLLDILDSIATEKEKEQKNA